MLPSPVTRHKNVIAWGCYCYVVMSHTNLIEIRIIVQLSRKDKRPKVFFEIYEHELIPIPIVVIFSIISWISSTITSPETAFFKTWFDHIFGLPLRLPHVGKRFEFK